MNTLLAIYLGTVGYSVIGGWAFNYSFGKKLENDGYEETKKPKFGKKLLVGVKFLLTSAIPVYNLFQTTMLLLANNKKMYEKIKEKMIEEGAIRKTEAKLREEAEKILLKEKEEELRNSLGEGKMGAYVAMNPVEKIEFLDNSDNFNINPIYKNMTDEEQSEFKRAELENAINEYNNKSNNSDNFNINPIYENMAEEEQSEFKRTELENVINEDNNKPYTKVKIIANDHTKLL